jgi:hypothetical protein
MSELTVGQEIQIITPLTITKIGTADLEVEYKCGSINKKLYIPKNICEPVLVTAIYTGTPTESVTTTTGNVSTDIQPKYKCDICGKVCKAKIALAGHMRSHKPKSA